MTLKRAKQAMPDFVLEALKRAELLAAYEARPPYQRNDYLLWINTAAKDETKARRMDKMLAELKRGHGYMGMDWQPR
ncbi:MAG: YdeI/OmpD-associated family protein [Paracoccaceae bacterium]